MSPAPLTKTASAPSSTPPARILTAWKKAGTDGKDFAAAGQDKAALTMREDIMGVVGKITL